MLLAFALYVWVGHLVTLLEFFVLHDDDVGGLGHYLCVFPEFLTLGLNHLVLAVADVTNRD